MGNLKEAILVFIDNQYKVNSRKNILSKVPSEESVLVIDHYTVRYLMDNREDVKALLREDIGYRRYAIQYMVDRTDRSVLAVNQFVNLTASEKGRLLQIYERLIDSILEVIEINEVPEVVEREVASVMEAHSFTLRSFLLSIQDSKILAKSLQGASILETPCFEYSVELQLHMLGLAGTPLNEPILDIGCGGNGHLVHYLRKQGLEAFGIDRIVGRSPYLIKTDWLKFSFKPGYWGTIISHMAFSNHFIHHHLRADGRPEDYALKMMAILKSLKISGSFYYAPGLPFIEDLLPPYKYNVYRRAVAAGDGKYIGLCREAIDGVFYSTQVLKIA